MRSFIVALTLAVGSNAIELETQAVAAAELQAQLQAAMINEYVLS